MNPHLFPMMEDVVVGSGHEITNDIRLSNVVFLDLHTRICDYDWSDVEYIINNNTAIVSFDEFDKGGLSAFDWPHPLTDQQRSIFNHIENKLVKSIHFCRLLNRNNKYPPNVYPFERSVLYEEPLLPPDDLFNREFDVVYIANDAPNRRQIAEALQADGRLKCHISLGAKKLEFNDFLRMHRRGKFFISSAAGGFTDERVQCLFSVAAIIRQRTDQLLLHDFTHLDNCLRIDSPPTKQDLDTLVEICADRDKLFEIYMRGYKFVKQFYSPEYIANNVLQTILNYAA